MAQLVVLEKGPLRTFQQIPRFQFLKTVRCLQVVGCCQQKQSQKVRSDWEGDGCWGGPQLMICLAMWFFLVRFFMSSAINRMALRFFKVAKGVSNDDSCLLWRNLVWNRGLSFLAVEHEILLIQRGDPMNWWVAETEIEGTNLNKSIHFQESYMHTCIHIYIYKYMYVYVCHLAWAWS